MDAARTREPRPAAVRLAISEGMTRVWQARRERSSLVVYAAEEALAALGAYESLLADLGRAFPDGRWVSDPGSLTAGERRLVDQAVAAHLRAAETVDTLRQLVEKEKP